MKRRVLFFLFAAALLWCAPAFAQQTDSLSSDSLSSDSLSSDSLSSDSLSSGASSSEATSQDDEDDSDLPAPYELQGEQRAAQIALNQFGRMWENEDMDTFDRLIAHDADMVIVGTDEGEYVVGYDAFRRSRQQQFESFENVEFYVKNQHVKLSQRGHVAWFTEMFDLFILAEGSPVSLENLRLSGVMEKRGDQWKIVQLHTSVPVAGQAAEY